MGPLPSPAELQELRRQLDGIIATTATIFVDAQVLVPRSLIESCRTALDELIAERDASSFCADCRRYTGGKTEWDCELCGTALPERSGTKNPLGRVTDVGGL
jgi:hypothetical protein